MVQAAIMALSFLLTGRLYWLLCRVRGTGDRLITADSSEGDLRSQRRTQRNVMLHHFPSVGLGVVVATAPQRRCLGSNLMHDFIEPFHTFNLLRVCEGFIGPYGANADSEIVRQYFAEAQKVLW